MARNAFNCPPWLEKILKYIFIFFHFLGFCHFFSFFCKFCNFCNFLHLFCHFFSFLYVFIIKQQCCLQDSRVSDKSAVLCYNSVMRYLLYPYRVTQLSWNSLNSWKSHGIFSWSWNSWKSLGIF